MPKTFIEALAGGLVSLSLILLFLSLFASLRTHSTKLLSILLLIALALFANSPWIYFAAVFIIATAITELDFLQNLAAIIRGDKNWFDYRKAVQGNIKPPAETVPARQPLEYKILNTLWTKQVNKWPDLSAIFTFRINANSDEFLGFREAGNKLIGEGLISETDSGQFYLTRKGFEHCKEHHREFPPDQWWPEEKINEEKLQRVLQPAN
ncbi:MAG: hypothetical protein HYY49_12310 [Ignavibacteriales bacterium]|nr:hypothetical protein [Ignavibacteriales bacterium]